MSPPSVWKLPWELTYCLPHQARCFRRYWPGPSHHTKRSPGGKTRSLPSHSRCPGLRIIAPIRLKNLFKDRTLSSCLSLGSLPGPWIRRASLRPSLLELKVYPKPMQGLERGGDGAKGETTQCLPSGAPLGFSILQ